MIISICASTSAVVHDTNNTRTSCSSPTYSCEPQMKSRLVYEDDFFLIPQQPKRRVCSSSLLHDCDLVNPVSRIFKAISCPINGFRSVDMQYWTKWCMVRCWFMREFRMMLHNFIDTSWPSSHLASHCLIHHIRDLQDHVPVGSDGWWSTSIPSAIPLQYPVS